MQHDTPQPLDLAIDPQLLNAEAQLPPAIGEDNQPTLTAYPMDETERVAMQEADAWLENMANTVDEWMTGPEEEGPSPLTSMAIDTRTARGTIYKGCRCPEHQDIYNDWPIRDAELTVALCMKVCVYCGKDYEITAELRKHMKRKYSEHNLKVVYEIRRRHCSTTPGWTRIEAAAERPETRATRNQSPTYGASTAPQE